MNGISAVKSIGNFDVDSITNGFVKSIGGDEENNSGSINFDSVFESAAKAIKQTDDYANEAEEQEINYAAGADNTLELMVAQNKANVSLSYTVAVRDKILEAYREIMNMQF